MVNLDIHVLPFHCVELRALNSSHFLSFCTKKNMVLSHLFWHCQIVGKFFNDVFTLVCSNDIQFTPTKDQFLFEYLREGFNSAKKFLVLHLKTFLWSTRFKSINRLTLVRIKNYFKNILKDIEIILCDKLG